MHAADASFMMRFLNSRLAKKARNYIKNNILWPLELQWLNFASDEVFTRRLYLEVYGREPDLEDPQTFSEKLNYIKLYYRPKLLTQLVDKYAVREYVQKKGCGHILNKLYGVYDQAEDIPFEHLPDQFVAKVTHGSNWNIICIDKNQLDWEEESKKLTKWLNTDFYHQYREWAYKDVPRRIMIEKYLESADGLTPHDYKFYYFNGKIRFIQVDTHRFADHHRTIYNPDWVRIPVTVLNVDSNQEVPRPQNLNEMIEIGLNLSEGLPFARIDFFSINGKAYFTEITIYPAAGYITMQPEKYDYIFGEMLDISAIPRCA